MKKQLKKASKPLGVLLALVLALNAQAASSAYAGEGESPAGQEQDAGGSGGSDNSNDGSGNSAGEEGGESSPGSENPENDEEIIGSESQNSLADPAFSPIMPMALTFSTTDEASLSSAMQLIADDVDPTGTITLSPGFSDSIAITTTINRDTSITLRCAAPLTLDSTGSSRHLIFNFSGPYTLTLNLVNITLDGGSTGGGVETTGDTGSLLVFAGGTITHCAGNINNGGGICADTGNVKISGGSVTGNSSSGVGGGVFAGGNVVISGGSVANNSILGGFGGGVYAVGDVTVSGGAISGNSANISGGGVYAAGNVDISGGSVDGNSAFGGGGVYAAGNVDISGGSVANNSADIGGGVFAAGNVDISGGSITDNFAAGYGSSGGGVFAIGDVAISNGNILRNSTNDFGGGVYAMGDVVISGGSIAGNSATLYGGGVFIGDPANLILTGGAFSNNLAEDGGYEITHPIASPYDAWTPASVTQPFTHAANNFDVGWSTVSGIGPGPVHYVAFSRNDGTAAEVARIKLTVPGNVLDTFPANPSRNGYRFAGWTEDADGGTAVTKNTVFIGSARVYAQWTPTGGGNSGNNNNNSGGYISSDSDGDDSGSRIGWVPAYFIYRVTFDTRGGSDMPFQRVKEGTKAVAPEEPTREGYVFTGWFIDEKCKFPYDFDKVVTKRFTLYAGWAEAEEEAPLPGPAA